MLIYSYKVNKPQGGTQGGNRYEQRFTRNVLKANRNGSNPRRYRRTLQDSIRNSRPDNKPVTTTHHGGYDGRKDYDMKAFEVGKQYTHGFIGDSELFVTWTVVKRTAQTVTITDGRETKTCKINAKVSEYRNAESVFPFGRYSMCPILSAQ